MTKHVPDGESADAATMDQQRLHAILESYGAAPQRWPADERDAALALLARSAEARAWWEAAGRLDAALQQPVPPAPRDDLVERLKEMPLPGQPRLVPRPGRRPRPERRLGTASLTRRLAPMAAASVAAFILGVLVPLPLYPGDDREPQPSVSSAPFETLDSLRDIADLAIVDAAQIGGTAAIDDTEGVVGLDILAGNAEEPMAFVLSDLQLE